MLRRDSVANPAQALSYVRNASPSVPVGSTDKMLSWMKPAFRPVGSSPSLLTSIIIHPGASGAVIRRAIAESTTGYPQCRPAATTTFPQRRLLNSTPPTLAR